MGFFTFRQIIFRGLHMPTKDIADLITQAEAARIRGVSREAIYGLVARKKLSIVEIGGQKFVRRSEVENYTPEIGGRPPTESGKKNGTKKGNRK
jgi:excisionase family DNA binding protein